MKQSQFSHVQQPKQQNHRRHCVENSSWRPTPDLGGYMGPYPKDQLRAARLCLIKTLETYDGDVMERVKPRIGIPSNYGPPIPFPSLPTQRGIQNDSCATSSCSQSAGNISQDSGIHDVLAFNSDPNTSSLSFRNKSLPSPISCVNSNGNNSFTSPVSCTSPGDNAGTSSDSHTSSPCVSAIVSPVMHVSSPDSNPVISPISPASSLGSRGSSASPYQDQQNFSRSTSPSLQDAAFYSCITQRQSLTGKRLLMETKDAGPFSKKRKNAYSYQCDFCENVFSDKYAMTNHLIYSGHYSGSSYTSVPPGSDLYYVQDKCAVVHKPNKYLRFVVVCSECNLLFHDMFQCGLHYIQKHGGDRKIYSLCPVVKTASVLLCTKEICQTCNQQFTNFGELHDHWKCVPDHHPVEKIRPEGTTALFTCKLCSRVYYENFFSAENHALTVHKKFLSSVQTVSIVVRFFKTPNEEMKHEVPLCVEDVTEKDSQAADIEVMRKTASHLKRICGCKEQAKKMKKRIRGMKKGKI